MTDPHSSPVGSRATHHRKRQVLRRKLRARGVSEAEITRQVEALKRRQQGMRNGFANQAGYQRWYDENRAVDPMRPARIEDETYERLEPADDQFRPTQADPLLRGAARATGATAKAVKRGKTITLHQYRDDATG